MQKKFKVLIAFSIAVIAITMLLAYIFSPFKRHNSSLYEIKNEITINAPVECVFSYLGDSKNAVNWSVFVKDIIPLNENTIPDGNVGSHRRCFVLDQHIENAYWDEEIIKIEPLKMRQLLIYNHYNFPIKSEGLYTNQLYEQIDETTTKLTFNLFYKENEASTLDWIKTYLAAFYIRQIFTNNLVNIKREIEQTIS